jgi:hypothetical protein
MKARIPEPNRKKPEGSGVAAVADDQLPGSFTISAKLAEANEPSVTVQSEGHNTEGPVPVYIDVCASTNCMFQTVISLRESVMIPKAESVEFTCVTVVRPSVKLNESGVKYPSKFGPSGADTVK